MLPRPFREANRVSLRPRTFTRIPVTGPRSADVMPATLRPAAALIASAKALLAPARPSTDPSPPHPMIPLGRAGTHYAGIPVALTASPRSLGCSASILHEAGLLRRLLETD